MRDALVPQLARLVGKHVLLRLEFGLLDGSKGLMACQHAPGVTARHACKSWEE